MADKEKPEETTEKKKGLLGGSKIPLDGVLLVVVPFVTFVVLFMYVMGLLPPRPMTVKVVGATPLEQVQATSVGAPEATTPTEAPGDLVSGVEAAGGPDAMKPVVPEPADSSVADAGGGDGVESASEGTGAEAAVPEDGAGTPPSAGPADVDKGRMERIRQLAKVYEQMNASSVAAIVTNMREDDAVDILSNMKARNAAKVLASLDPEKAATLSLRLTE